VDLIATSRANAHRDATVSKASLAAPCSPRVEGRPQSSASGEESLAQANASEWLSASRTWRITCYGSHAGWSPCFGQICLQAGAVHDDQKGKRIRGSGAYFPVTDRGSALMRTTTCWTCCDRVRRAVEMESEKEGEVDWEVAMEQVDGTAAWILMVGAVAVSRRTAKTGPKP
jgi:hypothetical protein